MRNLESMAVASRSDQVTIDRHHGRGAPISRLFRVGMAPLGVAALCTLASAVFASTGSVPKVLLEEHWDGGDAAWSRYVLPGLDCIPGDAEWETDAVCHPSGGPTAPSELWGLGAGAGCASYASRGMTAILESAELDLSSCLYDLSLEISYYLDFEEVGTYDRARVEFGAAPFDGVLAHNGGGSGQVSSCAGGSNPLGAESLFNLAFWLPLTLDLDGSLTSDVARLRFVGETIDGAKNSGLGFAVDDVVLACAARPPGSIWAAESFENDVPGSPPGLPEVGNVDYFLGHYEVEAIGSRKRLHAWNDVAANASWSFYSLATPLPSPALIEYDAAVGSSSTLVGTSGFRQTLWFGSLGERSLHLDWSDDSLYRLRVVEEFSTVETIVSAVSWTEDVDAKVVWWVDPVARTVSVRVNGESVAAVHPLPASFAGFELTSLGFWIGPDSVGDIFVDDLRISRLPLFYDGFESGGYASWSDSTP